MIPEENFATLDILNVGLGDLKISFDSDDPDDVKRAKEVVQDMLRQGYMIFVEDGTDKEGRPKLKRVRRFNAKRCEYIVTEKDQATGKEKKKSLPAKKHKATSIARTGGG
mgnify:CR=1 FL=1